MDSDLIVEVIEPFEMVKPNEVYPSVISEGETVTGRIAQVALSLEKGVEREPSEGLDVVEPVSAKIKEPPKTKAVPGADQNKSGT